MTTQDTPHEPEQGRATFSDEQLTVFGEIFPGFEEWYRANYDEQGHYIGAGMPGLRHREEMRGEQ